MFGTNLDTYFHLEQDRAFNIATKQTFHYGNQELLLDRRLSSYLTFPARLSFALCIMYSICVNSKVAARVKACMRSWLVPRQSI